MCLFKSAPSDVEQIFSGYVETNISDRYSQMIALCLKIVDYRSWTGYPRSLKRVVCGSLPTIRCQERWQHKAPICSAGRFFLIIWANFEIFLFLSWSLEFSAGTDSTTFTLLYQYLASSSSISLSESKKFCIWKTFFPWNWFIWFHEFFGPGIFKIKIILPDESFFSFSFCLFTIFCQDSCSKNWKMLSATSWSSGWFAIIAAMIALGNFLKNKDNILYNKWKK